MNPIRIIGPSDLQAVQRAGTQVVWTVSHAKDDWQRELSPFFLGPVALYDGLESVCMENAWQYAKCYAEHADAEGNPTEAYWEWARKGWSKPAVRYPMGKGAKPLYLLWHGEHLSYVEARRRVYWPLYRDAVKRTGGFARLKALHAAGPVVLFDFDGYDHERMGLTLHQVSHHTSKPMGHAFVLKAMLMYGDDIDPHQLQALETEQARALQALQPEQGSLF